MRMLTFAKRCTKEILRDPLNLFFGLGFPVVLLVMLCAIGSNVAVPLFAIQHLAPGICVFSLAFLTLFSASLIAKDRESAFLQRLYTLPLKPSDFILGYLLPMLIIALGQGVVCYLTAILLGLPVTLNILWGILMLLPISVLYISLGLLCGSLLNVKQVGGVCGALLTNLSAWLSGVWFELELVGNVFYRIAHWLPFVHAVKLERAVLAGDFAGAWPHLFPVMGYGLGITAVAIWVFLRKMKRQ